MTASAAAARSAADLTPMLLAAAVVVAGGLVEGLAVGVAQATSLAPDLAALRRRRYVVVTLLAAGLGWGLGSVPSVVQDDPAASSPPLLLMALGGAAVGAAMGVVMGLVQGSALRGSVRRPWRWVTANAAAWTPVMAVMMVGASVPSESWSLVAVLPWAALVGVVAGAVLGLVLARFVPGLGSADDNRPGVGVASRVAVAAGHRDEDR